MRLQLGSDRELIEAAVQLRTEVFVVEQGVDPEIEIDGLDDTAEHAVIWDDTGSAVLATARLLPGQGVGGIGRVAVRRDHRGSGLGVAVMQALQQRAVERGLLAVELHAQRAAELFYARLGYVAVGEPYLEAGIEHVSMRKTLSPAAGDQSDTAPGDRFIRPGAAPA